MELLESTIKFLHFVGFSTLFGAHISMIYTKSEKGLSVVRFGGVLAILTGIAWYLVETQEHGTEGFYNGRFATKLTLVTLSVVIPNVARMMGLSEKQREIASYLSLAMLVGIFIIMTWFGID